jgi:MerR family transcriptional regulator, light-induced transcriptional regulator
MNGPTPLARDFLVLRDRYLFAVLQGDRREALRIVVEEGLLGGATVLELQTRVIQEAQREVGRLWQEDRIGTAQEHMATAVAHLALAHLYERAPSSPRLGKRIVLACVEGELHDLPARIVADALDLAGFEVKFLGANVPTDGLVRLVAAEELDLIALSVTMSFNVPALREAVPRLRATSGGRIPIAVGGHACSWGPGIAAEVGADMTAGDAAEAVGEARLLLGSSR